MASVEKETSQASPESAAPATMKIARSACPLYSSTAASAVSTTTTAR